MILYVESNFVLELALQQEQSDSCSKLMELAVGQQIQIVIPAFCLIEPYQAISSKKKARTRLANDLEVHLRELSRSKPHREMPSTFAAFGTALIESADLEANGLKAARARITELAAVIALDAECLRAGSELEERFGLSAQDALVLASVLVDLETRFSDQSCFVSRNSKDFDDPGIREQLDRFNCKYFASFKATAGHLSSLLEAE